MLFQFILIQTLNNVFNESNLLYFRQLLRAVPTQQQLANQEQLIEMRMQELRHARDVREMYQRKLRRTNDLYMELTAVLLQLEQRERMVAEYVFKKFNL